MTRKKPKHLHKPDGRPTKMHAETIAKLEQAFSLGCSDREACLFANVSTDALYNYQKKHPKYADRKALLKEKTILKARQEVVKGLDGNPEFSLKYLERKRKDEFGLKATVENNNNLTQIVVADEKDKKLMEDV